MQWDLSSVGVNYPPAEAPDLVSFYFLEQVLSNPAFDFGNRNHMPRHRW